VLVLSLTAVVVVSLLAAAFLQLALSVTRRLASSADSLQALNIAEAGLSEAYTGLAMARTGNVGSRASPAVFGGGLFWVASERHASGLVELESTAMYGTGRATLALACEPVEPSVTALGLFSGADLALASGVAVDSFDSSLGPYGEQLGTPTNARALVGSNGDVTLASGSAVQGDVQFGPTGTLALAPEASLSGTSAPRPELAELPAIDVPEVEMRPRPPRSLDPSQVIPPGTVGYERLEVGRNSTLVLQGPLELVVGALVLRRGAELAFETGGGPVELFVTKELAMDAGSSVATSSAVPSDVLLLLALPQGASAALAARSVFHGFVYAPGATLSVSSSFEVFGGIACEELRLAQGARVHFDLALGASLESQLPLLHAWRVVDLPQQGNPLRKDPFRELGLDPDALEVPAKSHEDQVLRVKYVATDGSIDAYSGLESEFDWSQVAQLLFGARDGVAFFLPAPKEPRPPDPLLDLVASGMSSKDLRDALLAAAPVSTQVLVAACERVPPMDTSDLRNVLDACVPLADPALLAAVASSALDSSALKNVLIDNSPLSPAVLAATTSRVPSLPASDLVNVLAAQ
jgi:hypothetical protein